MYNEVNEGYSSLIGGLDDIILVAVIKLSAQVKNRMKITTNTGIRVYSKTQPEYALHRSVHVVLHPGSACTRLANSSA